MKDAERTAELEAALRRSELLVGQLQAQLNLGRKKVQAAPAGEREACSECNGLGFGPFGGCGECCGSGQASWQRTQSAGVPDFAGIGRDAGHPRAVVLYLRAEPTDDDLRAIQEALRFAAAPAQPAAQGELSAEVIAAAIRSVPAWSEISADLLAWEIFDYLYPGKKRKTVNGHYISCNAVSQFPAGKCNCGKEE